MKEYRVWVRTEKAKFFEELIESLNFCEFGRDESRDKAEVHTRVKSSEKDKVRNINRRNNPDDGIDALENYKANIENLRNAISKINELRESSRQD